LTTGVNASERKNKKGEKKGKSAIHEFDERERRDREKISILLKGHRSKEISREGKRTKKRQPQVGRKGEGKVGGRKLKGERKKISKAAARIEIAPPEKKLKKS